MDHKIKGIPKDLSAQVDEEVKKQSQEISAALMGLMVEQFMGQFICDVFCSLRPDESKEEPEDKKIVMVLRPGKEPKVLTCGEACELMPSFYERFDCFEDFAGSDLTLYYRADQVLKLDGRVFLLGAAVVCRENEDCDLLSLTGDDIYRTFCYASDNEAILCGDGKEFPAMLLE
ncbi:MAG: hypothetical protein LUG55_08690 [Clostridiales bacterium]|nr:hypothetical protein [Clostridiales bacterium]